MLDINNIRQQTVVILIVTEFFFCILLTVLFFQLAQMEELVANPIDEFIAKHTAELKVRDRAHN
jgi:hypothetical protein